MESVSISQNIVNVFLNAYKVLLEPLTLAVPQGTLQILLFAGVLSILVGLILWAVTRPKPGATLPTQLLTFRGLYDRMTINDLSGVIIALPDDSNGFIAQFNTRLNFIRANKFFPFESSGRAIITPDKSFIVILS